MASNYDRMSPAVRAACVEDDRQFRMAQLAQERQRAARATYIDQERIRAAAELAEQRGEFVSIAEVARTGGACLGRTRGEMLAFVSATQDMEDARLRALSGPTEDEVQLRHAALAAADPRMGRTKQEALAYFSAVQDIEDIENARAARQGVPTPSQEAAQRDALARRAAKIAARAQAQQLRSVASRVAKTEILNYHTGQLDQRFAAGEITEQEYLEAHRGVSA